MNGFKKNEKNHIYRSSDVIITFGLLVLALGVTVSLFADQFVDKRFQEALLDTNSLSAQILQSGLKEVDIALPQDDRRSIASKSKFRELKTFLSPEGHLGVDPWGEAYSYKIIGVEGGHPTHILVWSSGPDKRPESIEGVIESLETYGHLSDNGRVLALKGDDIGFIRPIR